MVFGVFDLLHPGHINFLSQAKKLGDYLIVSVARDVNVGKLKGYKAKEGEKKRVNKIAKLKFVDKVVLGGTRDPWPHIKKINPEVIALGYDQKPYLANSLKDLERELKKRKITVKVVRLRGYMVRKFKSSKLRGRGKGEG